MDKQKLNTVYNLLKELVGHQGAFIVFAVDANGQGGEDIQVRSWGPLSRQQGLMSLGGSMHQGLMQQRVGEVMEIPPNEPD